MKHPNFSEKKNLKTIDSENPFLSPGGTVHLSILCELRVENTFLTTFNTNFIEFYELHEFFYSKY